MRLSYLCWKRLQKLTRKQMDHRMNQSRILPRGKKTTRLKSIIFWTHEKTRLLWEVHKPREGGRKKKERPAAKWMDSIYHFIILMKSKADCWTSRLHFGLQLLQLLLLFAHRIWAAVSGLPLEGSWEMPQETLSGSEAPAFAERWKATRLQPPPFSKSGSAARRVLWMKAVWRVGGGRWRRSRERAWRVEGKEGKRGRVSAIFSYA